MVNATSLKCDQASIALRQQVILDGVSCELLPGSLTAVIGRNGAGKSTLLRAMVGLQTLQTGTITVNRRCINSLTRLERAKQLAWIPPYQPLAFPLTAREVITLGRFMYHSGHPKPQDHQSVQEAMAALEIEALAERPLTFLSQGEQQKVSLARGLASHAPIMLFDEPTSHLDIESSFKILRFLKGLSNQGHAIVCAIHDLQLALRFADSLIVLANQRCLYHGPITGLNEALIFQLFGVRTTHAVIDGKSHLIYLD